MINMDFRLYSYFPFWIYDKIQTINTTNIRATNVTTYLEAPLVLLSLRFDILTIRCAGHGEAYLPRASRPDAGCDTLPMLTRVGAKCAVESKRRPVIAEPA